MQFVTGYNLTDRQIATIEAIVCVVESGRTDKYNAIANIKGDTGGLSYGRHQASLTSGNLFTLVNRYCEAKGSAFGEQLKPFLPNLQAKNIALNDDPNIKKFLRSAGYDPVMVDVQDKFFFDTFMVPALEKWQSYGFKNALSAAVIYDSFIHGNFELIAKRATATVGEPSTENEKRWIKDYLEKRYIWLTTHPNQLLHNTAIRIEALQGLVAQNNWELKLPFNLKRPSSVYPMTAYDLPGRLFRTDGAIKAMRCTAEEFGTAAPRAKSGVAPFNARDRWVQESLVAAGLMTDASPDGDYGPGTESAVKAFQKRCKLPQTGSVGPKDFVALCEAVDAGSELNHPADTRPDSGLKPAPESKDKSTRIGGAGVATGGAVAAGAGAAAMGGAAENSSNDKPADTSTAAQTTAGGAITTPAAPALPKDNGKLCMRTDAMVEVPVINCKLSKVDTYTVGAVGLFVVAIGLVVLGRRVFDTTHK